MDHSLHITTSVPGLYVALNLMIALAYTTIPIALWKVGRTISDRSLLGLLWTFIAFIGSCGVHHYLIMLAIVFDVDGFMAAVDFVTAIVSVAAACLLWMAVLSGRKDCGTTGC